MTANMIIVGISAYYHDAAACLVRDGVIVAAAHEERFTRKKHDASFPHAALEYCMREAGISASEITAVVFYDKPFLKFERLLETYLYFAPHGFRSFLVALPAWVKEKIFLKRLLLRELIAFDGFDIKKTKLLFSDHHLSHAASAFYPSGFKDAAIITVDGVGEWTTTSIAKGSADTITPLKELHFPHSIGLLYSAFTYFLGFKVNSGEYKLMGLAPYGNVASPEVEKYKRIIYERLIDVRDDGSVFLNQEYFSYSVGLTMVDDVLWHELFGFSRRLAQDDIAQHHCDLALAIQQVTEDIMIRIAREAQRLTGARAVCLAGGVALNCVANSRIMQEKIFDDMWVQPAAGDAGGALGAALAAYHMYFKKPRVIAGAGDAMSGSYLGPAFNDGEILEMLVRNGAVFKKYDSDVVLYDLVAGYIADEQVVGWFQGRMEWGPRALGNRSIIADARSHEMQKRLNLKIKYREGFRPFAPSVLFEDLKDFFEWERPSPYMLFVAPVATHRRMKLPDDFAYRTWKDKLYAVRSDIPSVTHLDYSARVQTVHKETNERYWQLVSAFKRRTGFGVIVNTSFNVRGEPIVCTPDDAYRCFMRTEMDVLVLGNYVMLKNDQPKIDDDSTWRTAYALD